MRFRLWIKRIQGFRIKGLHRRRAKGMHSTSKPSKTKPLLFVKESPVYVLGNLSLPMPLVHPSNHLPTSKGPIAPPNHVNERLSRLSPFPSSSALTTTPAGHNTPLALKDLLAFEAVDKCRKPNMLAHITSCLSCCKVVSPETTSGSNCQESNVHTMRDQKVFQGKKAKWTGLCPCMLVSVENQIVKQNRDAWRIEPVQTTQTDSGSCSAAMQHIVPSINGQMKDTDNCMQTSAMNAIIISQEFVGEKSEHVARQPSTAPSWVRVRPGTEHNSSIISTPFRSEAWSELPGHPLLLAKDKNLNHPSRSARHIPHQREKLSAVYDQASARAITAMHPLPEGKSSFANEEIQFRNQGGLNEPATSSSSISKVHHKRASHFVSENAERSVPSACKWLRGDGKNHQEQPMGSHGLALGSTDHHALETNQPNELVSEEEAFLLQADSYESSDTFSISSLSPWQNDQPKPVPSQNASIDLEARARPWTLTENHAGMPTFQYKSVTNLRKSKREHATSLIESHHAAFMARPVISSHSELKNDPSALPAEVAGGNQELKVYTSAHDCNVNEEQNPACNINKGLRIHACKDDLVSTHGRSKSQTIILPAHIHNYAIQELNHSSAHAFNHQKDEQGRLDVDRTNHRAKSHTIMLPSASSNAYIIQEQIPAPSAVRNCRATSRQVNRAEVKGSILAVVEKKSRDPYVDFIDSMLDTILQNHLCSGQELEGLLQSLLSLNPLEHHDVIVQAFTEVWEKVVVGKAA